MNYISKLYLKGQMAVQNSLATAAENTPKPVKYIATVASTAMLMAPAVLAASSTRATNDAKEAIGAVISIAFIIATMVGVIFVIVGLVRFVIAHNQENGPGQTQAAMMIASGVALIALRVILQAIGFKQWVEDGITDASSGNNGKN